MRSYENSKKKIMEIAGVQECYEVQFNLPASLYHVADESGKGIDEVLCGWLENQSFTDYGVLELENKSIRGGSIQPFFTLDTLTDTDGYCIIEVIKTHNLTEIWFSFYRKNDRHIKKYEDIGILIK